MHQSHDNHTGENEQGHASLHWADGDIKIFKLVVGPLDNNVFVLQCQHSGESVLIDAANEHMKLLDLCRHLEVRTVLETHGHWDHIQAIPEIRDAGYEVGISSDDSHMLPSYDYIIGEDHQCLVGETTLETIATPGHTPGSVCFKVVDKPILFSGDTLFPGGPGATRFPESSFDSIISSIDLKLLTLPQQTVVMPGHGDDTTIGTERPNLDLWVERGW